jgi:hypothetical protein
MQMKDDDLAGDRKIHELAPVRAVDPTGTLAAVRAPGRRSVPSQFKMQGVIDTQNALDACTSKVGQQAGDTQGEASNQDARIMCVLA